MLNGKAILITGAASGIGRRCAEVFAANGARVLVTDLSAEAGAEVVEGIRNAGGEAAFQPCNVTDEASVAAAVDKAVSLYGRLDGAMNNAGIEMRNKPVHELTAEDIAAVLGVDLVGVFYCLKHQFRVMKDSGGGAIVNTASSSGIRGQINASDYVAAKHGVVGLTKAVACDGGPLGIRVNALCPGLIMTPMAKDRLMQDPVFSEALEGLRQRHVIGRFGEMDEIANAAMFLLSDMSSFMTGSPMIVDGGYAI
ncbi:SDR family oxidoreductase [Novosphingobium resinovorum]|jgi:NAD(P)-dependent dehydrogenase (short-subunit alcohol dehydrogenase family)|uniref:Oxidoreductase n=1 Tax=Novosphingobium resinovorum TaxID=158500 RepID=A0A031JGH5_9SPHN|nr:MULTISPECIES: SDR family oxidoreductase [Novosphingobium]AOR78847.1 oxidoreductase [Novosphingobium resinovorum]EZP73174.1 Short-chain dehydrogenase/reductase SDR [Novosphingobium resinovorum]MBF7014372.1 SDR family oxidoreductase [Novosphingobium sp. HR1a]WJM25145.1 SDR family oxidoreductase [Novosphingobium resinovorum]